VHRNLYAALPYLVNRDGAPTSRALWIDAICINQTDDEEKTGHIGLMHKIYQKARTVSVCLGVTDEQERIPEAISLLPNIFAVQEVLWPEIKDGRVLLTTFVNDLLASHGLASLDPAIWSAIMHLLKNEWFKRVWVGYLHLGPLRTCLCNIPLK
jgi:hypothetical protein